MPIQGKLYSSAELQTLLKVKKQRISNLAKERQWAGPQPGLYWAAEVEPYLVARGIDPATLPVVDYDHQEG